jgi:glycerol-3-phosphate dehydrogenase
MRIERDLSRITEPFDLAVVGGGITGTQIAREAAGRGLRTVMIDKGDFGGGTSSATSKLIHGGIRYLENRQFGVVRESLKERRILALSAPHLVEQRRFLMPGWRWSKPSTALIGAGVGLYTVFGFDRNRDVPESLRIPMPRWLPAAAVRRAVPWIDPDGLQGAFAYHDTMNLHPERLLLGYAMSAADCGAVLFNHMEATGFILDGDTVRGVEVLDGLSGQHHRIQATTVVNAGGPWLDLVLKSFGDRLGVNVVRSKGVHLLTTPVGGPGRVTDTVFARARSGNHVIVSPWQGMSFIGPTDTEISGSPDSVRVVRSDVELILQTLNDTLGPGVQPVTEEDVLATTVGIRPLVVDEGADSYTASRRHEIYDHAQAGARNLWSVGGGKWTTGRATGVQMVSTLLRSRALEHVRTREFDSATVTAAGAFAWASDAEPYLESVAASRTKVPLDRSTRLHLARLYGTGHERLFDLIDADPALAAPVSLRAGRLDIAAQVVVAVVDEGARTLADIVDRRLVLGTLGGVQRDEMERVAVVAAGLLGWDHDTAVQAVEVELARRAVLEQHWRGGALITP